MLQYAIILHTLLWYIYTTMIVRLVANARTRPGKRRRQNGWMVVIKKCRDVIMLAACEKKEEWLETNFIGCRRHMTETVNFIG